MTWNNLFNNPNFSYNVNSKKIILEKKNHLEHSIKLLSIIYKELTFTKLRKILEFFSVKFLNSKNNSLLDFGSGNGAKKHQNPYNFMLQLRPAMN